MLDVWVLASALLGVACAGLAILALVRRDEPNSSGLRDPKPDDVALLFRNSTLIDAHDIIWLLLRNAGTAPNWADVKQALNGIAPAFPETPVCPPGDPKQSGIDVQVSRFDDITRVTLSCSKDTPSDWFVARQNAVTVQMASPALNLTPSAIWCIGSDGDLLWQNETFERLAETYEGNAALAHEVADLIKVPSALGVRRICLGANTKAGARWFDVFTHNTDAGCLHFATSADAIVEAEEAQRNFVQTLSKTFANLTTGLAIFNRDRRLALFNPSLIDLSSLSAEFLSGRPNLFEFFDKLREQQIMPEPKNYDDWRERMAKLVAAASDDRFRETWNLAGGQTYDVTGRSYPDGAIAFLFNDITAEVSLTRGFRTELETMQSLIDVIEDAVAVFTQQGILTVCNAAYKEAWGVDPDTSLDEANILDATQSWKEAFHPSPVWPEIRDFVTRSKERASWDTELRSRDGREVVCRLDPICYGATLIRFCTRQSARSSDTDSDHLEIVSA